MREDIKEHLRNPSSWKRLVFMIVFGVLYNIAEMVLVGVVVLQFLISLFTGRCNVRLLIFGKQLSKYIYDVMSFLTYNSEQHPFPFSDWPTITANRRTEDKRYPSGDDG